MPSKTIVKKNIKSSGQAKKRVPSPKSGQTKAQSRSVKKAKPTKLIRAKAVTSRGAGTRKSPKHPVKPVPKAEPAHDKVALRAPQPKGVTPKVPSREFAGAVAAYETGIKLMYAENYEKAIKCFN